jgi:cytochrome c oxidase assembly protein subunit 15
VAHACLAQAFFALVVTLAQVTSRAYLSPVPGRVAEGEDRSLALWSGAAAVLVYLQVALGAVMRHTGAGLAIPDVPLAFGRLVPPFLSVEIAIHFAHRAGAVVVAAAVACVAAFASRRRDRPDLKRPARLAALLVAVQILLGGLSVWSRLAVIPTTVHLVCGALLLASLLSLTLRAARGGAAVPRVPLVPDPRGLNGTQGLPA